MEARLEEKHLAALGHICEVAAERFGQNAKLMEDAIDKARELTGDQGLQGSREVAEDFRRKEAEATAYAQMFAKAESVTVVHEDVTEDEEDGNSYAAQRERARRRILGDLA